MNTVGCISMENLAYTNFPLDSINMVRCSTKGCYSSSALQLTCEVGWDGEP